jgi:hypothetical protein
VIQEAGRRAEDFGQAGGDLLAMPHSAPTTFDRLGFVEVLRKHAPVDA